VRKIITLIFVLGLTVVGLAGCSNGSWIRDNAKDYEKAKTGKPLQIPKELHPEPFSDQYCIPEG